MKFAKSFFYIQILVPILLIDFSLASFHISKKIGAGDGQKIIEKIKADIEKTGEVRIFLGSEGGHFYEALEVAKFLRQVADAQIKITTEVGIGDGCDSACTLIFSAGNFRKARKSSSFYFHPPHIAVKKGSRVSEQQVAKLGEKTTRLWLEQIALADPEFSNMLFERNVLGNVYGTGRGVDYGADWLYRNTDFVTNLGGW